MLNLLNQTGSHKLHRSSGTRCNLLALTLEGMTRGLLQPQLTPVPLRMSRKLHEQQNRKLASLAAFPHGVLEISHLALHAVVGDGGVVETKLRRVGVSVRPQRLLASAHVFCGDPNNHLQPDARH